MVKKAVVLYSGDKPIKLMEIKEFANATDFTNFQKECEKNWKEFNDYIESLINRLEKCEKELAYNRGDVEEL